MDPNQRHPSPVGTGMTQTFPVVQSGLEFQYGRMPGFQQMQGKPINIQGMVGNTVNTYNYISNFTGILPQGQGSVMAGVPQGTGSMMAAGIPQGQASMNMMTGVPGQGSMMASVHQGQSSMMAGVPQGQGSMLSGINQGQSSMVAGVSQHVQSSSMSGVHQQGPVIAGTNQQGQGSLMANVPQGQGSLLASVPQGQTGQIMTNIQGTAVPMNSYISAASSGGTLPSMGSFVASFNQPNFNMNQYVVPNCKGGMESWIGQQQPQAAQGAGNALPSFGHFLMPQQYQQQSPRQQQPQHPQHPQHQQQIQHQQLFPTNQNQTRFPSTIMQQAGMGQIYPVSSVNPIMNQGQAFANVNINTSMNVSTPDISNTVVGPNNTMGLTHNNNLNIQNQQTIPCSNSLQMIQSSAPGSTISASCNQMTNTTSTVITTISSRSAVPVTANVHIRTSASPAVVPSSVPAVSLQSNIVNNSSLTSNNSLNVKQENSYPSASSGCDNNNKLDNTKLSAAEMSKNSDEDVSSDKSSTTSGEQVPTQTVIVPFGWRRVHEESVVTYYSPSNTKLGSLHEIKQYLSSEGTCKCGLECPVIVEKIFNFDPSVQTRQWSLDVHCAEDLTKLCNHKRKIIAMATFQSSKSYPMVTTSPSSISGMAGSAILSSGVTSVAGQSTKSKKETKNKKKKSKVQQSPYDGLLVSQLLAQRDKLKSGQCKTSTTLPGQQNTDNTVIKSPQDIPLSPGGKGQNVGHQFNSLPSPAASDSGSQGRASVKDPADDLGPISSGKPIKLDFSRGIGPLDGLQRMSANTPSMSPGAAGSAKTGNQFMQQNPLTVQTVFPPEHFKDQVFIQQSPHTPSGHSPAAGFGFPQGQLTSCANYGVGVPMGTPMNMQQNPGLILHGNPHHGNFPFYSIQNPPAGRYIGQNMMNSGHPFHGGIGQNIPGPYHMGQQQQQPPQQQQQGMFQPPNAILQSMVDVGWPSQEPKKRQRKSRAKKDKKKVNCVFESDTPPPNVDVSQLQDHGRGPIPKVKKSSPSSTTTTTSSSFLENPTAFLAEQTALISNSLTSTLSSPKASNMGTSSSEIPSSVGETKNCDTVDGDINSSELPESSLSVSSSSTEVSSTSSVSTTTTASINPTSNKTTQHSNCFTSALSSSAVCTSSSATPIGMSVSSITPIGLSSDWRTSTSNSESHPTSSLTDNNNDMFTEDRCESLSPDSGPECPALNETITPSSVVHHTATNDAGDESQSLKPGSIKSNLADKNIIQNKTVSHIQTSAHDSLVTTGTTDGSKIPVSHTGTGPASQIENVLGMVHRCNRNVGGLNPIQQMLGCQNTNEFPASNLLSAAARAQVVQQQQMGLFMGQSPHNLQVSQSLPINMGTGMAPVGGSLNVPLGLEFGTKISQNNKGMQILTSDDGQILINQQSFPVANNVGITLQDSVKFGSAISPPSSKISSPVNVVSSTTSLTYPNLGIVSSGTATQDSGTKIMVQSVNGLTNAATGMLKTNQMDQLAVKQNLNNVLAQAVGQAVMDQNSANQISGQMVNTPMPPLSLPIVTGVTNSLTQVIPAVSGSQQPQQSMMNMFNNMGINALQNGSMMVGQIPTALSQDAMHSMSLLNGTMPAAAYLNNNIPGGFPRFVTCSNGMVNIDSQSGTGNAVVDLGFATKQGQLAAQMISGDPSTGCVQLKTSQPVDMGQLSNKLSVQCDGTEQVMQPTVLLPNIQMPLVQVLGGAADQMQVSQNLDKANMQQFATIPNSAELQGMINQLQAAGQTPVGTPLNLMNVQQVWNNLTTGNNLTAMQLQTLHLQQQLLQQIQQLQGMQTLISQFNVQGNPNNTITTVANKDGNTMATNGQLTFTVTTNASLESVINSESKTSMASMTNSDAVAMGTMVNDVSTTSDFYSQDKSEDSDQEEGSLADDNCEQETEIERGGNSEYDMNTSLPAMENEVVSSSVQTDKCVDTTERGDDDDKEQDTETVEGGNNSVNVTSSVDKVCDNPGLAEQTEEDNTDNSDIDKSVNSKCTKSSREENVNDYVQPRCQTEALNLSTFKSDSAKTSSFMEASNEIETSASRICKNSDKQIDTTEENSICKTNLSVEKSLDCDKNEFKVSDSIKSCSDTDKPLSVCSGERQTVTGSVVSSMAAATGGGSISVNTSVSDLTLPSNINIATSSSASTTSGNFYSSQSRVKSSPEHRSSIAEKPVEATLPSDIITTKSMDIRNCSGLHLYQASHMVQSVELSSETAEKAADALTIVNKSAKRPLDMEDYLDEDADDSTEETGISSFPRCFSIGDLVWGQIRGFPSWPGKVVHETEVIDGHQPEDGKCWVKWFGDHTFTEVEPDKLKSLSEGLEAHHRARKKYRKGRKMNSNLEAAIHEAMIELDRQTSLSLESKSQSSKITIQRGKMKKKRTR